MSLRAARDASSIYIKAVLFSCDEGSSHLLVRARYEVALLWEPAILLVRADDIVGRIPSDSAENEATRR